MPEGRGGAAARARLAAVADRTFDVVVVGGGITGAGVALEAARRGWRVALLEAADFGSGTSGRSSKLIHGGLRYVAMGDFALVREGARERAVLHRLAPHLAEPAWMVLPARNAWTQRKYRLGITLYEWLGAVVPQDRHRNWDAADLAREEPLVDGARFPYACAYREYLTDDARLVVAVLRAARDQGAAVVNHVAVEELLVAGGRTCGVRARCALTGAAFPVRGPVVVNAAGPWAETLLPDRAGPQRLHLSKGVHLLVSRRRLPARHLLMLEHTDGRPVFVLPRGNVVWIGTTDTTHPGAAERWPEVTAEDVAYLLGAVNRFLPRAALDERDVRWAWAGLRPLIARKGHAARNLSRRDEIWAGDGGAAGPPGLVSVAGGKLTGFRPMARKVADAAGRALAQAGVTLPRHAGAPLTALPGGGAGSNPDEILEGLRRSANLSAGQAARLARLYGREAPAVAERGAGAVVPGSDLVAGEVSWAVEHEAALTLEDLVYRRLRAVLYEPEDVERALPALAELAAPALGWDAAETARQLAAVRARLAADRTWR